MRETDAMQRPNDQTNSYGATKQVTGDGGEVAWAFQQAVDDIGLGWFQLKMGAVLGLGIMADSMELGLIAVLSSILRCQWHLNTEQEAAITTAVFCGALVGAVAWGSLADSHGRRTALVLSMSFTLWFSFLSVYSPNYTWILITRALVGFGIGGAPLITTIYSEFVPTNHRAMVILMLSSLWAFGSSLVVCLALLVVPTLGWRYLLAFTATPVLGFVLSSAWLPESPRFHLVSGKERLALTTLKKLAAANGRILPCDQLQIPKRRQADEHGGLPDLFSTNLRGLTFAVSTVWFVADGFGLVGIVLMTTSLLQDSRGCFTSHDQTPARGDTCFAACKELTRKEYLDIALIAMANIPGVAVSLVTAVKLGRTYSLALQLGLFAVAVFLLSICVTRAWLLFLLMAARIFMAGATKVTGLYTAEVFPTTVRASGQGFCSSVAKAGALLTPFVAQVLLAVSVPAAVSLYGACAALAALVCMVFLPETKGKAMKDVPGEAD